MYALSSNIDPNKIFLVNRSKLEGRIDPEQYHNERIDAIRKLKLHNKLLKLKDVVISTKTITTDIYPDDIYIGLENITSNTGEYLPTNDKQSISSANIFKKGQILFPKLRPYLNKVYLAEFNGICSTEFHVFDSKKFDSEFLSIYLRSNLIVNQTKHLMTGNTLPRLQTEDIYNLPVPDIEITVQKNIAYQYRKAFVLKQQKESDAKSLLESIDTYLLDQLDITLPEQDNSLQNRIFVTPFSLVTGRRFDPNYALNFSTILSRKPKYPFVRFQDIFLKKPQYGANEEAVDGNSNSDVRYIRITDIDEWGNLRTETWKTAKKIEPIYLLNENDILIARTGATVGKAFIYKETNDKAIFAGYMIRFFLNQEKINPDFAFYYLNSSFFKFWVSAIQRPSAQPNINSEEYKSLPICLPPLEKQIEIASHIQAIRAKAKALQQEAEQLLNEAKKQVEQMIIGE